MAFKAQEQRISKHIRTVADMQNAKWHCVFYKKIASDTLEISEEGIVDVRSVFGKFEEKIELEFSSYYQGCYKFSYAIPEEEQKGLVMKESIWFYENERKGYKEVNGGLAVLYGEAAQDHSFFKTLES